LSYQAVQKNSAVYLDIVTSDDQFDALELEWKSLFSKSKAATSPLRYEWQREWWRVFGVKYGKNGLRILTGRNENGLLGVLPMYLATSHVLGPRRLQFISTGESSGEVTYPEYNNCLYDEDFFEEVFALFTSTIFQQEKLLWDHLDMGIIGSDSPLGNWFAKTKTPGGYKALVKKRVFKAPYADLSSGFDGWLKNLSGNARQQFRRLMRKGEQAGVEFSMAKTQSEAGNYLRELIELHTARWKAVGQKGSFSSDRLRRFHTAVAEKLVPSGGACISRLSLGKKPIALLYGFIVDNKFDFYQSGVAEDSRETIKQPGMLAHLLTMRELSQNGIVNYDFLAGDSEYKKRLASNERELWQVSLSRRTFPALMSIAFSHTKRGGLKFKEIIAKR